MHHIALLSHTQKDMQEKTDKVDKMVKGIRFQRENYVHRRGILKCHRFSHITQNDCALYFKGKTMGIEGSILKCPEVFS